MEKNTLFLSLAAIAAANPEGFTVDAATLQPVTKGYAVALADTQNSFGEAGLRRVIEYQRANAATVNAFGGWLDTETGKYYWDATVIVDNLELAKEFGYRNKQLAIFDLANMLEIRL